MDDCWNKNLANLGKFSRMQPYLRATISLLKPKGNIMTTRQLKDLLDQMEGLKSTNPSAEFQAGVDAAKGVLDAVVQETLDRERIQKLEAELSALRAKYPAEGQAMPKRRGRRPKNANVQEAVLLEAES
jgi:ABC-type Fe3+-citrate transport system substrate-binding protein